MKSKPYQKCKPSGIDWLGDVPYHWHLEPLKYNTYAKGRIGWQNLRSDEFIEEGPYLVTGMHFKDGEVSWKDCYHISQERYEIAPEIQLLPDDVLITKDGSIGKLAYISRLPGPATLNSHLLVLRPLYERYLPRYLFWYLSAPNLNAYINLNQTGTTFFGITQEAIVNLPLLLPTKGEQRTISSFLDRETAKIDTLIAKQEKLIELLKEKRQAVISHAVTKGLNPAAPMKPSGVEWLGDVPEHWKTSRVKFTTSFITSGPRGWSDYLTDEGPIFLQSGDLNDQMGVEFTGARRVAPPDNAEGRRTALQQLDVVVCITGANTGRVAVIDDLPEAAFINQHLALVRPIQEEISSRYMVYWLASRGGRTYFDVSQYGLKEGLSLWDISEAPCPVPPLSEQYDIVAHLDTVTVKIDALIHKAETAIALQKEHRTALISAAVTGKIDVRESVSDLQEAA